MKRLLVGLVWGATVVVACADLTQFRWRGGSLVDNYGDTIPYGQATVFTVLDNDSAPDIAPLIAGNQIDIADLHGFRAYSVDLTVGPHWEEGLLHTDSILGDGSVAGKYAYAIVAKGIFNSISDVAVGDSVGIVEEGHLVVDLRPSLDMPPETMQDFNPGSVETGADVFQTSVVVIPEPATLGLMGMAGLVMFLARRQARA